MSTCPADDRLVHAAATSERDQELAEHLRHCDRCQRGFERYRALTQAIAAPMAGLDTASAQEHVMTRIAAGASDRRQGRPWRRPAAASLTLALLALVVVVFAHRASSPSGDFRARGGGRDSSLARHVGVEVYAVRDGALIAVRANDTLRQSEGIALGYRNQLRDENAFLLAFVIDSEREIHWLYPAYIDAHDDPQAIELPHAAALNVLPDSVVLDSPAPGNAELVWILATEALAVSVIESLKVEERTAAALQRRFADAELGRIPVRLQP